LCSTASKIRLFEGLRDLVTALERCLTYLAQFSDQIQYVTPKRHGWTRVSSTTPATRSFYSSILRGIASRFQNFASRGEVAPRKRVAISTRSQLHACCQVETRRDATLVEMRREVRAMCDRGAASCYINPSEPWYIVFTHRCNQNKKQHSCRICPIGFGMFCHPILPWKVTICCLPPKPDNDTL
jgi:hypothetical protein